VIRRHQLGAKLRRLREARSLRLADAAGQLGIAASTLSRIETGKAPTRLSYLTLLLDLYAVTDAGQRHALTELARDGRRAAWWTPYRDVLPPGMATYLGLEHAAGRISIYTAGTLPQLTQTREYAEATHAGASGTTSKDQISWHTVSRSRQRHLKLHAFDGHNRVTAPDGVSRLFVNRNDDPRHGRSDFVGTVPLTLRGPFHV